VDAKALGAVALAFSLLGCDARVHDEEVTSAADTSPGMVAAAYCKSVLPPNRISVTTREAAVFENNDRSIRSLTIANKSYHQGQAVLGWAETSFQMRFQSDFVSEQVPDSTSWCSSVNLAVEVSMPYHLVNIARELRPGTCGYEKVREHEYMHVEVNRATLAYAAATLQSEMDEVFSRETFYGDPKLVRAQLDRALSVHWIPRLRELQREGLVAHQDIDTEDEYASNATACDGEISRLVSEDSSLRELLVTVPTRGR